MLTTIGGSGRYAFADGTGTSASFLKAYSLAFSPDGSKAAVADNQISRIRSVVVSTGSVTMIAGNRHGVRDGTGTSASFQKVHGVAFSPDGRTTAVADSSNHCIRLVVVSTGAVRTIAGKRQGFHDGTCDKLFRYNLSWTC